MTADDWPNSRLDDLAAQVRMMAALATQVATHHAEISGHDDDIAAVRSAQAEALARTERMLSAIGESCERHTEAVRKEVRAQGAKIDKQNEKLDALSSSRRFTSAQYTTMITTGMLAIAGILTAVLAGAPG